MKPELKQAILDSQSLPGWCMLDKAEHLALLALDKAPKLIVEIGVFGGRSLIPLGLAAQQYGGKVYGVDPWRNDACLEGDVGKENAEWWGSLNIEAIYQAACAGVKKFRLDATVELLRMMDHEALTRFEDNSIGILHVDGNHSSEVSRRYIEQWGPKIEQGGYLIMDDIDWPTQAETVKLIEKSYQRITIRPSWGVWRKE